MFENIGGWTQLILAVVGIFGAISAFFLNRRGSDQQALQQRAANDLANRAQGFDEMKIILEALRVEISRKESDRIREIASQAEHCRHAFEGFFVAFQALQLQVASDDSEDRRA